MVRWAEQEAHREKHNVKDSLVSLSTGLQYAFGREWPGRPNSKSKEKRKWKIPKSLHKSHSSESLMRCRYHTFPGGDGQVGQAESAKEKQCRAFTQLSRTRTSNASVVQFARGGDGWVGRAGLTESERSLRENARRQPTLPRLRVYSDPLQRSCRKYLFTIWKRTGVTSTYKPTRLRKGRKTVEVCTCLDTREEDESIRNMYMHNYLELWYSLCLMLLEILFLKNPFLMISLFEILSLVALH